jgi:hypothetical protein
LLVNNSTGSGTGSGAVTVNGGVLGGTGTISGVVTVNSGGTVAPGTVSALGTLTLNSVPTLNGTNFMRINRNGGSPLSDRIVLSGGTLNYGSTLVVSNVGAALIGGEVFTNFVAPAYTGVFSTAVLPPLSNGLNWYLGSLVTNGTIKVNRQPTANGITVTNTPGQLMQIPVASLVASATDPDGDSLAVGGFDSVTTNGILLSSDATYLYYSNNVNVADRFNYTITDGKGGSATGAVQIAEAPLPASFSLNASATNGVVSKNPDQGSYPAGSMVTLTATPDTGYSFFGWSGDAAGTNNPLAVTLTSNMTIVANFVSPQPARFQLIETLPDNRVRLVISGENGVDYAIDGSSNLLNWQQIGSLVSTGTVFEFVDDGASSNATRFYRTRR